MLISLVYADSAYADSAYADANFSFSKACKQLITWLILKPKADSYSILGRIVISSKKTAYCVSRLLRKRA